MLPKTLREKLNMFRWKRSANQASSDEGAKKSPSGKTSKKILGLEKIIGCENTERRGDVIFVHGLRGHALTTWHPQELEDEESWLYWLGNELSDIGIWSFGYEAEFSKFFGQGMPRFDQASSLLDWLEICGIGERPLLFITHSLGGLLVKEMLRAAQDFPKYQAILEQTKGIVFLATPHTGSHLANLVGVMEILLKTRVTVDELRAHEPSLRSLKEWYGQNVRKYGIATKVYYETEDTWGYKVVDEDSANPGIEDAKPIAIEADHITIAKPESRNTQVYIGVKKFIQDNLKPRPQLLPSKTIPLEPVELGTRERVLDPHKPL